MSQHPKTIPQKAAVLALDATAFTLALAGAGFGLAWASCVVGAGLALAVRDMIPSRRRFGSSVAYKGCHEH